MALQKNKFAFAAGLVAISLVLVLLVAFLKLNN
jgi:cbb3-type cytochrome oxidase subunit 3